MDAKILLTCMNRLFVYLFTLCRFMSQVYALGAKIMCNNIAGLVNDQRQLCRDKPDLMISIGKGAKLGVEECQKQFKDQRWNCSTVARDVSVFGKVTRKGVNSSS